MTKPSILFSRRETTTLLVIANILILALFTIDWSGGNARTVPTQANERVITVNNLRKNEPVEISDVKVKGKAVKIGEAFAEDAEWLKKLDFTLINKWDKAITYVVLNVDFPETRETGSVMMYSLYIGRQQDVQATRANPSLRLEPNQSTDVSLATQYEEIKKFIETRQPPIGNIKKIKIWLDQVMFEDDTLYSGGSIFRRNPDPNSPHKWLLVRQIPPLVPDRQAPPRD